MVTATGILILIVGLVAWIGQTLAFLTPALAVRLGVLERKEGMDASLYVIEAKAEGLVDMLLTWTFPLSALLMLLDHPFWPYLGLIGSGMFLYIAGLIPLSRVFLKREGKQVGSRSAERAAYVFGAIWALSAVVMIAMSVVELSG